MPDLLSQKTMSLSSHANVYNTCLRILRSRGFALRVEGELDPDGSSSNLLWVAEKNHFLFRADNPIELLGLTAVYEFVQPAKNEPYWWQVDGPDIWEELWDQAFPTTEDDAAS